MERCKALDVEISGNEKRCERTGVQYELRGSLVNGACVPLCHVHAEVFMREFVLIQRAMELTNDEMQFAR